MHRIDARTGHSDEVSDEELRLDGLRGGTYRRPTTQEVAAYRRAQRALSRLAAQNTVSDKGPKAVHPEPAPSPAPEIAPSEPVNSFIPEPPLRFDGTEMEGIVAVDSDGEVVVPEDAMLEEIPETNRMGQSRPIVGADELRAEHPGMPRAS